MVLRCVAGAVVLGALIGACSSSGSTNGPGGSSSSSGGTSNGETGEQLVNDYTCKKCHGDDMSGQTSPISVPNEEPCHQLYPPNLTPDKTTGIGNWTDAQLTGAIVNGIDNEGERLCPEMQHYPNMPAADVTAIIGYLRSIAAVSKTVPSSICPPLKGACGDAG